MANSEVITIDEELERLATEFVDGHNKDSRQYLISRMVSLVKKAAIESKPQVKDSSVKLPDDFAGFSTGAGVLYTLADGVTKLDVKDHLHGRLMQLEAMLTMTCGNGADNFQSWNDEMQDTYLWACNSLATECKELAALV